MSCKSLGYESVKYGMTAELVGEKSGLMPIVQVKRHPHLQGVFVSRFPRGQEIQFLASTKLHTFKDVS